MRYVLAGLAILAALMAALPTAHGQAGYDRPGGDYSNFTVRSGDPAACATRCGREQRCRAWSFSYPGTVGINAICWLKSQVTPRVENACCVSGVKGADVVPPRDGVIEFGIDRIGGDLRDFDLAAPDPTGTPCREACEAEARCRAWTYVRPGYEGAAARCFLKEHLRPPRRRPCCISGVVR